VLNKVEAGRRLRHTHSCGDQQQTNIRVSWKKEFTAVVVHRANTKEAANALCRARQQFKGIQRVNRATCNLLKTSGMEISTLPLPRTSTPTPPTRAAPEGGSKDKKSLRNAVRLMDQVESTTRSWERSRPGDADVENAIEQNVALTSVSSYSSIHSIFEEYAPGASPYVSDACISLSRAL
jgi:hypothetical protein